MTKIKDIEEAIRKKNFIIEYCEDEVIYHKMTEIKEPKLKFININIVIKVGETK